MLLGANVQTGFSRQEFNEAASLFNKTVIVPMQRMLTRSYKNLDIDVDFEKYNFDEE